MTLLCVLILIGSLIRLAWVDVTTLECDPLSVASSLGALFFIRYTDGDHVAYPLLLTAIMAGGVYWVAKTRPGRIGMGDTILLPLIVFASPQHDVGQVVVAMGVASILLTAVYAIARGKPLLRMFRYKAPLGPVVAIATIAGAALLMGATNLQSVAAATGALAIVLLMIWVAPRYRRHLLIRAEYDL